MPEVTPERRQAVSVTLENSYDDWCVAQLAKALGKQADAAYFTKLAHNYKNVFNPQIGFMAPRSADGQWVANFDPKLGGGQGGRDYFTEVDSWLYTFSVQHDLAGLIQLMGGRDAFNAKLDRLFVEQYGTSKYHFLDQFPDATGLVGLYAQGNEPSFHIPYLYDFSGQPWKTQQRVRQLMDIWYGDGPLGIPGDDDGGETSSWYVLSAMGFYPVCPGSPVYEIGSPIFAKAIIRMGNGKDFAIIANHVSAQNKYIQSARAEWQTARQAVVLACRDSAMEEPWSWRWATSRIAVGQRAGRCSALNDRQHQCAVAAGKRSGSAVAAELLLPTAVSIQAPTLPERNRPTLVDPERSVQRWICSAPCGSAHILPGRDPDDHPLSINYSIFHDLLLTIRLARE